MGDNANRYTMEELWGKGIEEVAITVEGNENKKTPLCIKLSTGGYVMIGHKDEILEVQSMTHADTFDSIEEANKIIREKWLEARIEEWKADEIEDDE